jgi:hypothetical protein
MGPFEEFLPPRLKISTTSGSIADPVPAAPRGGQNGAYAR